MNSFSGYIYLFLAIILGITANGYLKATEGFTKIGPAFLCSVLIVLCIFCIARAMMNLPVGFAYASYGGLTITGVTLFGVIKYNQIPNIYGILGILFIIVGVVLLNTLAKAN